MTEYPWYVRDNTAMPYKDMTGNCLAMSQVLQEIRPWLLEALSEELRKPENKSLIREVIREVFVKQ